ncbi:MAG TPA: hypothetical protein VL094_04740 [Sphingomonadaceae bacterium]|nr:hypothetical protein [Sphingomonadaceae bacterium]
MQDAATLELETLLDRFAEGIDTSLAAANRLEVLLSDMYPDDDVVADRVGDLAQYRPGGGDYLLDTEEMQSRLARLSTYIASLKT